YLLRSPHLFARCATLNAPRTSSFLITHPHTTYLPSLPLHDALPICTRRLSCPFGMRSRRLSRPRLIGSSTRVGLSSRQLGTRLLDRKSTRLNSSHVSISYAVFCLNKKKKQHQTLKQEKIEVAKRDKI